MKKLSLFSRAAAYAASHKILSIIAIIVAVGAGYWIYKVATAAAAIPQYTLAIARSGNIAERVTGSGQVSASNQTDILGKVSGTITSIPASVGQRVSKGDLIATIDSTNAASSLRSAEIAYEKLVQPPKATDVANAQNSISKSLSDGYSAVAKVYLDLPDIMAGMKDMLYGQSGFISDQRSSYLSPTARTYRETSARDYDIAVTLYQKSLETFKAATRSGSATTTIALLAETRVTAQQVARAVTEAQNAITFITSTQPDYNSKDAASAASNINSWATTANADVSSIVSAENAVASNQNSYTALVAPAEALDLATARLNLEEARRTYADYFIRAPYDGIIGRIPVNIYGQSSASTVIATIVGSSMVASISLNEVDAAKVQAGQRVDITFDAIEGLQATGTVAVIDQVGSVSNGVVSYGVKISISTTDPRIKPGMSVNVSIVTKERLDVLIVPSTAIKTEGTTKYVQTFSANTVRTLSSTGTSTRTRTPTISTTMAPVKAVVTIGDADDTHTEVLSGIDAGTFVVTKTSTASTAKTTTPNIFNTLGAGRTGPNNQTRQGSAVPR